jgi:hypothetical protein
LRESARGSSRAKFGSACAPLEIVVACMASSARSFSGKSRLSEAMLELGHCRRRSAGEARGRPRLRDGQTSRPPMAVHVSGDRPIAEWNGETADTGRRCAPLSSARRSGDVIGACARAPRAYCRPFMAGVSPRRFHFMGPPGPLCLRLLGLLTSASGEARDRARRGASTGAAKMLEPRNAGLYSSGRS